MATPLKEGMPKLVAWVLALPAFLIPIYNPDLFWHLSAARRMISYWMILRADFLSFSMQGEPWLNFEWMSQLIFYGVHQLSGFFGLWALKALLLFFSARLFLKTLDLYELPLLYRCAGLVFWSLAALAGSDIRPELFSVLLFSALVLALEAGRLGRLNLHPASFFAVFALWANLHAGFIFGLLILACYAFVQKGFRKSLSLSLGAAALGSLCTPYGWGPYLVSLEHWKDRSGVSSNIQEWRPMTIDNAFHWPFWPLLILFTLVFITILPRLLSKSQQKVSSGLLLAGLFLAVNSVLHARFAVYFAAVALPIIFSKAAEITLTSRLRRLSAALAVLVAGFFVWTLPALSWAGFFDPRHTAPQAADVLQAVRPQLEGKRLYHEWEWGGYLGWRLPWLKVFWDGRYLFHGLLEQASIASSRGPEAWQEWLGRHDFQGALVRNRPERFPTTRLYKDGTSKEFLRPWHQQYYPRSSWALVYWDERSLLFLRRDSFPAKWLDSREYRYLRPGDEAALADALERGEIDSARLEREKKRQAGFLSGF